jgi:hypothetical protein
MNLYIVYWDTLGFEYIENLSDWDKREMWATLGGKPAPRLPVHYLIMRAKANPQRRPEIWTVWSELDREALVAYSKEYPQELADAIRRLGERVFVTVKEKELIK